MPEIKEEEMLNPVLQLFPASRYDRFPQVPLGRKKIDLYCHPKNNRGHSISVELKTSDWKCALWQASINFQISEKSYIAIWHEYAHRVQKHIALLESYGVGLIIVNHDEAVIFKKSRDKIYRIARKYKRDFYQMLINPI